MKRFFLIVAALLMATCFCYSSEVVGFKYLSDTFIGTLDSLQSYNHEPVNQVMHKENEKIYDHGFTIHNEEEYRDLFDSPPPPQVDFTRNMILGRLVSGRCGNKTNFTRTVIKDDASKQIIYSIKLDYPEGIKMYEPCELSFGQDTSMNLIMTATIPEGYKVVFLVDKGKEK